VRAEDQAAALRRTSKVPTSLPTRLTTCCAKDGKDASTNTRSEEKFLSLYYGTKSIGVTTMALFSQYIGMMAR
jgi:hypothetical protein